MERYMCICHLSFCQKLLNEMNFKEYCCYCSEILEFYEFLTFSVISCRIC